MNSGTAIRHSLNWTTETRICACEIVGKVRMTEEMWKLVDEIWGIKARIKQFLLREHGDKRRMIKRSLRRDKRKVIDGMARRSEEAAVRGDSEQLYRLPKQLSGRRGFASKPVGCQDGSPPMADEDQLTRWKKHFLCLTKRQWSPTEALSSTCH